MHLVDEVLQHLFRHLEIGDHAVFQRPDSGDIARRPAQHALGVGTYGGDRLLTVVGTDRNHRRLVQHDPFITHINERVRRP